MSKSKENLSITKKISIEAESSANKSDELTLNQSQVDAETVNAEESMNASELAEAEKSADAEESVVVDETMDDEELAVAENVADVNESIEAEKSAQIEDSVDIEASVDKLLDATDSNMVAKSDGAVNTENEGLYLYGRFIFRMFQNILII